AAKGRRDFVINRMLEDGYLTEAEAATAHAAPLITRARDDNEIVRADYFVEEVRRELQARYGENGLYRGGLSVRTTLDSHLQDIPARSLGKGLRAYGRRHGWRGALGHIDASSPQWPQLLAGVPRPAGFLPDWYGAVVLGLTPAADGGAEIGFADGSR